MQDGKSIADKVAIVTGTFYDLAKPMEELRARLALQTVHAARDIGYEIIVVDGGSPTEFVNQLSRHGAHVFPYQKQGMGNSRREAIQHALQFNKETIAFTEPEKAPYIPELWKTAKPILDGEADMVVPKRKSLESVPVIQQLTEGANNLVIAKLTGVYLDHYFGPRTWRRDLSYYFLNYDGRYGDQWDALHIPAADALFDRKRIIGVEVDYTHPPEQTAREEEDFSFYEKRLMQMKYVWSVIDHWNKRLAEQSLP